MTFSLVVLFILAGTGLSIKSRKLTFAGAVTGALIAFLIFVSIGFTGLLLLSAFFIIGTVATSWKKERKANQSEQSTRTTTQVLANAGVPAILAITNLFIPGADSLILTAIAACFSSAAADTVSSELGIVYGRRFFNVVSFKEETKGLDGVVSFEGTVLGLLASTCIALLYAFSEGWNLAFIWIIIAGTAGNLTDSLLGAWLERKSAVGNDTVNILNTLTAALTAMLLVSLFDV